MVGQVRREEAGGGNIVKILFKSYSGGTMVTGQLDT